MMVDDPFSWLVPWSIDGCWRLMVISIPIAMILGYRSISWKKGLVIGYMIWTLTILETLLDLGFGFYLRKPELYELMVKLMLASSCAGVGALSGYIGTISLQGVTTNITTKRLLAFIVLFFLSSGLIITSLLMLPSPVKHDIMQLELEDLILQYNGTRITTNPGSDEDPRWSTDGKKMIFVLRPDVGDGRLSSKSVVAVMDADGNNLTQMADGSHPVVYADKIVFQYRNHSNIEFWIMDIDAGNKKKVISLDRAHYSSPTLSPDGTKICYVTSYAADLYGVWWKNGTVTRGQGTWERVESEYEQEWLSGTIVMAGSLIYSDIWVMNVDESNTTNIASGLDSTNAPPRPTWSPDGNTILYLNSTLPPGTYSENIDIWIMDADGRNKKQLTNDSGYNVNPVMSPDSGKIVYMSGYPNRHNYDIWVVNSDGSNKKSLTHSPTIDFIHGWTVDGKRIVYKTLSTSEYIYAKEYNYDEKSEIWIMESDGNDKELLLSIPYAYGTIGYAAMSPDGSKMAVVFDFYKNYRNSDIYLIDVPGPE